MKKNLLYSLQVIFVILLISSVSMRAQEIGVSASKIWTDNYELRNPSGYGIYFLQPVGKFGIKLEFVSASNQRNYFGFLSAGFFNDPESQTQEHVSSNTSYRGIEFSIVLPRIIRFAGISLGAGIGAASDRFECTRFGMESQKNVTVDFENKLSAFYEISLSSGPVFGLPIIVGIEFKHKALGNGSYATDTEQPFVALNDMRRLQLNAAYRF